MSTYMMAAGAEIPVGFFFEFDPTGLTGAPDLSTPAKVREYFGYGTWEEYGSGRVTVGAGAGYTVGSEGGEESHKLTVNETPRHSHIQYAITRDGNDNKIVMTKPAGELGGATQPQSYGYSGTGSKYLTTGSVGNSAAHNNLQPYRTVYRWRRIA